MAVISQQALREIPTEFTANELNCFLIQNFIKMNKIIGLLVFSALLLTANLFGQKVTFHHQKGDKLETFILENSKVMQKVVIKEGLLLSDTLQSKAAWTQTFHRPATRLISDADFNMTVDFPFRK